jgi:chorismate mutase
MYSDIENIRKWGSWNISNSTPLIIAGPCSAESEEQVLNTAKKLKAIGKVDIFRSGIWKPRTRPGQFEGIGHRALEWLQNMRKEVGLPFVVEVANSRHVEHALAASADALWIGARTTVNPFYVQEIAESLKGTKIPLLIKNPIHSDLGLWIGAFERFDKSGIKNLAAVHRGFYASNSAPYRNDPKWEISFDLRRLAPEIPIICDPSHIAGTSVLVEQIAQVAMDIQMDGLMIEVHPNPNQALSDAEQQITPKQLESLLESLTTKSKYVTPLELQKLISEQRKILDTLDSRVVKLLEKRMKIVDELGHIKATNKAGIFQMERWFDLLKQRGAQARELGLNEDFINDLFQIIHKYSVEHQTFIYQGLRSDE